MSPFTNSVWWHCFISVILYISILFMYLHIIAILSSMKSFNKARKSMKNEIKKIPCDKTIDNSLLLLFEGYPFIQNRCKKYKSDIFETRLLGHKTICMRGEEAAKIFYDDEHFIRKNVGPKRVRKTLLRQNGVQCLDGSAHKDREEMLMSIMNYENLKLLIQYTREQWETNTKNWNNKDIVLFDEAQVIMCQVACRWVGIPLKSNELNQRAVDLGKMIDGFGAVGLRYWKGKCARKSCEKWIAHKITRIRSQKIQPNKCTAAYIIAWHRDENKRILNTQIATVELLNIIKPIVAIATYITFGALAMHKNPACRLSLKTDAHNYRQLFVQEVRRFYPFTSFILAKVKRSFFWKEYYLKKGTLVLLDVYGTNHCEKSWSRPYEFIPERFINWDDNRFSFIPQGGGDFDKSHRCAGELVTVEIMKESFNFLTNNLSYKVPKQNLNYPLCRIPTLPKSRFVIKRVMQIQSSALQ